jgi:hypothetical protein
MLMVLYGKLLRTRYVAQTISSVFLMLDMEQLLRVREQLNRSGRIREILDDEGKILPSQSAMELVAREHAGESDVERYCLAQCLTLLELADKYREDLK